MLFLDALRIGRLDAKPAGSFLLRRVSNQLATTVQLPVSYWASVIFKLCCLLFLLIGDALWGCRTGLLAREGAPGAEGQLPQAVDRHVRVRSCSD
jgi:hypothetical protein